MEFVIKRADFYKAVKSVLPAIGHINVIPASLCAQITVQDGQVTVIATDQILTLKTVVLAETKTPGSILVHCKALSDVLELLPEGDVKIAQVEGRLQIRAARSALHLNSMAGDQFPGVPNYDKLAFVETNGLFTAIDAVSFACGKNPDRYLLQGVFVRPTEVVGLDGHRLAVRKVEYPDFPRSVLVPAEGLSRIQKVLSDEKLGVSFAETELHFHQGNIWGTLKLLQGDYPDYNQVIPKGESFQAQVRRADLLEALKIVSVVTDKLNTVVLTFKNNQLHLFAESPESGKAETAFEIQCAGEVKIGMSAKYVRESTEALASEVITFELRDHLKPVIIRDGGDLHVIMPKRL